MRSRRARRSSAQCGQGWTGGEALGVPEISRHDPPVQIETALQGLFELFEMGRGEISLIPKNFHGTVPAPHRDQGDALRSSLEGVGAGADGPLHGLLRGYERRGHQNEDPQADPRPAQRLRGTVEVVEGHPLVQPGQGPGMDGLQSHGHFQAAGQALREAQAAAADQAGMAFHGDAGERGGQGEDLLFVFLRHGPWFEEVAGVVELHGGRLRQGTGGAGCDDGLPQLDRQGSGRRGTVQGLLPKIAEDAGERALGPGQEDGQGGEEAAVRLALLLPELCDGGPGVDPSLGSP
jgi:hypothetical protein